jgi:hypothetical protein
MSCTRSSLLLPAAVLLLLLVELLGEEVVAVDDAAAADDDDDAANRKRQVRSIEYSFDLLFLLKILENTLFFSCFRKKKMKIFV